MSWSAFVSLVMVLLVISLPAPSAIAENAAPRPNVLFIAVDDLRPELGCYGVEAIKTPAINGLAKSGVIFNRAYCQLAVCNPSRVSVMTGLRPDSTKVWDLRTRFRDTIPDAITLPQHFMKHGYHTESYGKIFHNPWPDNESWSQPHQWPKSSLWSPQARKRLAEYRKRMRADGKSDKAIDRMRAQATEKVDIPDDQHIDGAIAVQTLAAMRRLAGQKKPFFLATGFIRPHLPFVVPRKYWDLYESDDLPLARNSFLPKESPRFAMNTMYELRDYFDFSDTAQPGEASLTEAQQRRLKHGYYASVSFVDAQIGRLLAELKTLGLAEKTIVVFWSDHGWKLGEHNSWCKQTNYEIDARVPFIVRVPGFKGNGMSSNSLVELVDIYPTLCDLAGLPISDDLEGNSLVPMLRDPSISVKRAAFSQFQRTDRGRPLMGYSMRTDRFRYIEWQDRRTMSVVATELYDHANDTQENMNIANRSGNKSIVDELHRQLWNLLPEPPAYSPVQSNRSPKDNEAPRGRPKITFRNTGQQPVTLSWIPPNGEDKNATVIKPGQQSGRMTSLGHRFRVRSQNGGEQIFVVKKQQQTFEVDASKLGPAPSPVTLDENRTKGRPNIVVCVADDWSWPHASMLGDPAVKTPNFDRVAKEGVLFQNAFISTPSCTPSRLSILTGQHHWRLKEGDSLGGSLREEFPVYTEMLQKAGYKIGRFGKGVWPSKHQFRSRDSFGEKYRSFNDFLKDRDSEKPYCYWHGGQDPHRPYDLGVGKKAGIRLENVNVPACLPDAEIVRSDFADYLWEVQRFDSEVGEILQQLEDIGELENTILVVTSDNGMPFPRCKATLYDQGTRVPLAIRWGKKVKRPHSVADFVTLCDLAPTFLEAAGLATPKQMTGHSLLPQLTATTSGQVDPARTFALAGIERHVYSYPSRALRTKDFLYIRNFSPAAWPSGEEDAATSRYDFSQTPWPTSPGAFSFNIDPSPSKQFLRLNRTEPAIKKFAELSFSKRPNEELFDLKSDPNQLHNVASNPRYAHVLSKLRRRLSAELIKSNDPRVAVPGYSSIEVEGWPVRVSDSLKKSKPEKTKLALRLLAQQIKRVEDVLTGEPLAFVKTVPIWLSPVYEGVRPTAEYHPGADWLKSQGRRPELIQCVEFTNIDLLDREVQRMPMVLLHELAHAYHHQVLGFENPKVNAAYRRIKESVIYEAVERNRKTIEKAYGLTNAKEYFAESTEAYFGINDFYPYNRTELEMHDPPMAKLLGELWMISEEGDD